ncbi:MAG TPA: isoprenylcysteine carboxylmethyltransferase family protein [Nanoarchaeota archaeon]|nr:isoprenylcysteine carboxylmethyltransferase family protein [Candidatus Woesearchaeota archaeon]HIH15322.1 isoprenylcysteine carboxylmethyltransferase family protein [Nanoarchaeota archaeon]HIH59212.1 isoprenylcysteine carboxylmethyltransferase family protein [Nanoarchaeota archaeon]HII13473.1 isoprenylcysteine carboxylmethyltransferase family protein [Nanoarchaeota archaeon]HIJ05562.1 isoprenylcysteine carboxylmethyltransferase family protein [Nanoarchaeota archaeon]
MKEKIVMLFGFRKGGKSFDTYSLHFILIALALIIIATFYEVYALEEGVYSFYWLGALLFLIGAIIRTTARIQLGKLFTFNVKILDDHKVKSDGLYAYMRHPGYTGMLIEVIGWCIFFQTWLGTLATIIFLIPSGYYRIKVEEKILEETFKEYGEYKKKVKALIPKIF